MKYCLVFARRNFPFLFYCHSFSFLFKWWPWPSDPLVTSVCTHPKREEKEVKNSKVADCCYCAGKHQYSRFNYFIFFVNPCFRFSLASSIPIIQRYTRFLKNSILWLTECKYFVVQSFFNLFWSHISHTLFNYQTIMTQCLGFWFL